MFCVKISIVFLILPLVTCWCLQVRGQDTMHWSASRKLEWQDFHAIADTNSRHRSATSAGVIYTVTHRSKTFSFTVATIFYRNKSWAKAGSNEYLLQHEQTHFDIAELYARKLRQAFKRYMFTDPLAIEHDLDKIAANLVKERDKLNMRYDVETNYSLNTKKQAAWNKRIGEEIAEMQVYK